MLIDIPSDTDLLRARVLAAWDRPADGGDLDEAEAEQRALELVAEVRAAQSGLESGGG